MCPHFQVFSLKFQVLHQSLIHMELIFVMGERWGSRFILIHVDSQFSQLHFLKMQSLFDRFLQSQVTVSVWVYMDILCSIDLCVCFCTNAMLFLLLQLCNITWDQESWHLQHYSFCTGLLWLAEVFCTSI